jgi:ATP-dependent RNA helicase DeaD
LGVGYGLRENGAMDTGPSTFAELDLGPELLQVLQALGYEEPTPIQREAVPPLLAGRDLVGQAATGTGKTAAFALPLLQRLPRGARGKDPTALVLAPTRELAVQVAEAIHRYGEALGARVLAVYGGQPIGRQLRVLERGVDVVVATPGRVLDHLARGSLRLGDLQVVVLDEADEMFDMGFAEDIEAILQAVPVDRQTVLFSATLPPKIDRLARRYLRDPVRVQIERELTVSGTTPRVRHEAHLVKRVDKPAALARVLDMEAPDAALVFCRTREEVDSLTEALNSRGRRAEALHGGMSQEQRDRVMGRLRGRTAELLVATDVAARGLDVDHLTHVVNYNVPSAPDSYVHRTGRVGRAGRDGVAITLVEPREQGLLKAIVRVTGEQVPLEPLPTQADLQARRLDATRTALTEAVGQGGSEPFRAIVEDLAQRLPLLEVAATAVRLLHESGTAAPDRYDLAPVPLVQPSTSSRATVGRPTASRPAADPTGGTKGGTRPPGEDGYNRRSPAAAGMARLFIGAGRNAGVRPQDLVGAIAGESTLSGREVGAIEITERFSLVDVPASAADEVVTALRKSVIKGRKALVRRDRDGAA